MTKCNKCGHDEFDLYNGCIGLGDYQSFMCLNCGGDINDYIGHKPYIQDI